MKFLTVYDPERMSFRVYLRMTDEPNEQGAYLYRSGQDPRVYAGPQVVEVRPGEEPPIYMRIEEGLARALAEALAPRPEFGERHMNDAIEVRDRLLAILESEHLHGSGDPGTVHLQDEAELRRERERRARR